MIYPCTNCKGTGQQVQIIKIPRCRGCGHEPLDFSAYSCPRCHRNKRVELFATAGKTCTCTVCLGTAQLIVVTETNQFLWMENESFAIYPATPENKLKYAISSQSTSIDIPTEIQRLLNTTVPSQESSQTNLIWYYGPEKKKLRLSPTEIVKRIKQKPNSNHQIYTTGEWLDGTWVENKWVDAKKLLGL